MKKRGSSLVSVLLVASLCVILAFTVAGVSISHLGVANHLENAQVARLNAEAAAHHLIGLICENPKLGTPQGPPSQSRAFEISLNGGVGRVSFDATAYGMPPCLNNLSSDRAVSGWKRTLPPHSLQIISQGIFRNEVRTLESILVIPPYKYALATTGDFRSDGGLRILGVESLDDLNDGLDRIPKDKIKPGHLASNSEKTASDDPAIDLKADSANPILITGDALAVGSLRCDSTYVTIEGAPRGGSEAAVIPQLDIENYDPALMKSGYQTLSNGRFTSGMNVTSAVRLQGSLSVQGGLNLDDGYVFVDGNVNIEGGVHGKGMIVSTGNVTVHGRADLGATDSVGLAAKGDVEMIGQASNQSQMNRNTFRGVIYTEGDFKAEGLQLVGTVLGNKQGPKGSEMKLTNVNLIHHPGSIDVDWSNGWEPELGTPDPYWSLPATWAPAGREDDFTIDKLTFNHHRNSLGNLALSPDQMRALADATLVNRLPDGLRERSQDFTRTVFAHELPWIQSPDFYPAEFPRESNPPGEAPLGLPSELNLSQDPRLAETPWYRLVKAQIDEELAAGVVGPDGSRQLDGINSLWWTKSWSGNSGNPLGSNGPMQFAFALHTKSGKLFNSPCDYITYVYDELGLRSDWGPDDEIHDREFDRLINLALSRVKDYDDNYAAYLDRLKGRAIRDGNVNLDPNQFIQLQDKMKRVLVREVTP